MKRAAKRRLAEAKARQALSDTEVYEITDPIEEFGRVISEAVALKDWMAAEVSRLQTGATKPEDLRATLGSYRRQLDACVRYLGRWVELGLAEQFELRRVQLRQAQQALVAIALSQVLARLDVSEEQQAQTLLDLGTVMQELSAETGEWLPNPWLHVESPGLDAAVSAYEQEERKRKLERAADVLIPSSYESERTKLFDKIDTMAERIARPANVVEVEKAPGPNTITDPKTGEVEVLPELDPPPPREPEVVPPKRTRVAVADIHIPELDPWHRSLPSVAGRRPAPEPEPDAKDEPDPEPKDTE